MALNTHYLACDSFLMPSVSGGLSRGPLQNTVTQKKCSRNGNCGFGAGPRSCRDTQPNPGQLWVSCGRQEADQIWTGSAPRVLSFQSKAICKPEEICGYVVGMCWLLHSVHEGQRTRALCQSSLRLRLTPEMGAHHGLLLSHLAWAAWMS